MMITETMNFFTVYTLFENFFVVSHYSAPRYQADLQFNTNKEVDSIYHKEIKP